MSSPGILLLFIAWRFVLLKVMILKDLERPDSYHQVEMQNGATVVLASASNPIWPKADIVRRDYAKTVR